MNFLKIILDRSKIFYVSLVCLSVVNGLLNTGLLMFINKTITQTPLPYFPEYDWLMFLGLIGFSLLITKVFQTYMIHLTTNINFDFELAILKRLRYASYQDFEKLGNEKVFTAIEDIRALGNLPEVFMNAINALIVVVCCFVYLFLVSFAGSMAVLALMVGLVIFYLIRNTKIERDLRVLRSLQNDYFRYLNDFLLGFKELKMSLIRTNTIYEDYLKVNRTKGRQIRIDTSIRYMNNELTGNYSWYLVLAMIMFLLPRILDLNIADISAFLITILYLVGPIAVLITLIPIYTNVKIALDRLGRFDKILKSELIDEEKVKEASVQDSPFESLKLENLTYEYFDEKEKQVFVLGPLDLQIEKGELIFVIGGNGSGKSTFVYLLTGLYRPDQGSIYLNGDKITRENYLAYSDKMSAIFTHTYLFDENYNKFELNKKNEKLIEYIELMQLSEIIRFNEEKNALDNQLSKGQQKRLAMIYSMLENKDIIILDEWAAEQDPQFRSFFYKTLIPSLRKQGKTIIVITHDDDYFSHGDRIVKFDYGKIAYDKKVGKEVYIEEKKLS